MTSIKAGIQVKYRNDAHPGGVPWLPHFGGPVVRIHGRQLYIIVSYIRWVLQWRSQRNGALKENASSTIVASLSWLYPNIGIMFPHSQCYFVFSDSINAKMNRVRRR